MAPTETVPAKIRIFEIRRHLTGFAGGSPTRGAQTRNSSEDDYLGDVARAVFERIGKPAQVQVDRLSIAQAKSLAKAGLRAFVISRNMGLPDGKCAR